MINIINVKYIRKLSKLQDIFCTGCSVGIEMSMLRRVNLFASDDSKFGKLLCTTVGDKVEMYRILECGAVCDGVVDSVKDYISREICFR